MDVNEQENSSKINLNSDDREFGTDITNIINIDRTEIINVKQGNFRVTTQGQV